MMACFDINQYENGDRVLLYEDKENDIKVFVDIEDNPSLFGGGTWSGGALPSGNHTITPNYSSGLFSASFKISVSAFPVVYNFTHSPSISGAFYKVSNVKHSVINPRTSSGIHATASLEFTAEASQGGYSGGTFTGYLISEMDTKGRHRVTWNF